MTAKSTDPQPENTPGLEPGGGVAPGDTPPIESSMSESSGRPPEVASRRTNMAIALVVVGVIVVATLALFAGRFFG